MGVQMVRLVQFVGQRRGFVVTLILLLATFPKMLYIYIYIYTVGP
jgi:hypothetical protein